MRTVANGAEEFFLSVWNMLLASGMALTPSFLGFQAELHPAWSLWLASGAVTGLTVLSLSKTSDVQEYALTFIGCWTCAAPWVLGFEHMVIPLLAHLGFGFALVVSALTELWRLRSKLGTGPD
jgi:hypothetical protein